jgi:hypothetical protein
MSDQKKARKPRAKISARTAAQTKNMERLNEYSSTNAKTQIFMTLIQQQYKSRDITNIKTAVSAMDSLKANDFDEFKRKYADMVLAVPIKNAKKRARREKKETVIDDKVADIITKVDNKIHRPGIRTKNWESEAPSTEIHFKRNYKDFNDAWKEGSKLLIKAVSAHLTKKQPNLKLFIGISYTVIKQSIDYEDQDPEEINLKRVGDPKPMAARTKPVNVYNLESVRPTILGLRAELEKKFWSSMDKLVGPNWAIDRIQNLFAHTHTLKVQRGASYLPIPPKYANTKCGLINPRNTDQECFKYCMRYHQSPQTKNSDRITVLEKAEDNFDYGCMTFPPSLDDIKDFEEENKITINIFRLKGETEIESLQDGNVLHCRNGMINLLLIEEGEKSHYIYINNIERPMKTCIQTGYQERRYCPYCRTGICCEKESFEEHLMKKHFSTTNNCNLELPEEGATMKFKNYKDMLTRPWIVYADFEASLVKTQRTDGKTHRHKPNSVGIHLVCTFDETRNEYHQFNGADCVVEMIKKLRELSERCIEELRENQEMVLTREDKINFKDAETCYLCEGEFTEKNWKVRDHDHRTGHYRGACHNRCNISHFTNRYLPVFFHNLKGYDSHHILRQAVDIVEQHKIHIIPQSTEKYMTFSIGDLKFLDTAQFMASGLDTLVKSLKTKNLDKFEKFNSLKQHLNEEELELICQKGFYPYEYIDDPEKLKETGLPPRKAFYSKLRLSGISKKEYKHAQNIYNKFKCYTFQDYHNLYLTSDVLLLSDVFEHFRKTSIEHYKLDPANFITAAGYAWSCMLLKTGVELELITDLKVLDIVERSKRGGLTFVGSKRYAKANNKHMVGYDPKTKSTYLMYLDANNLYGWSMVQDLPYKDIKFNTEITIEEILRTEDDAETGYTVEVDLSFPQEIHERLKQLPPCPETRVPEEAWFSEYQKELNIKTKNKSKCQKLIPHFHEHLNYCSHYRTLKYVVEELGVRIDKLHNVVEFKQKKWMQPYIEGNNALRTLAKNDFEKDFFKLMNNSVFGKTMQNVRTQMNLHLTTDRKNAIKRFSKCNFKYNTYADGLYLIETYREKIVYYKPVYIGCSILDISKLKMLEFHYEVIDKQFGQRAKLIYSDTDSFVYEIEHEDIYKWQKENEKDWFDLSDSKRKYIQSNENKKKLGFVMDELNSQILTEWISLNPKCYAYRYQAIETNKNKEAIETNKIKEAKKAKGDSQVIVEKNLTLQNIQEHIRHRQDGTTRDNKHTLV